MRNQKKYNIELKRVEKKQLTLYIREIDYMSIKHLEWLKRVVDMIGYLVPTSLQGRSIPVQWHLATGREKNDDDNKSDDDGC